jgi:2-polyprenyl-3-methyl-5-hydroxy-6-metoxy-1,4-benzoquinol methylase
MKILEDHFAQHGVTSVLDFACGTGAQAIPLAQKGYRVTACDINQWC